jgi:hypothetical protein
MMEHCAASSFAVHPQSSARPLRVPVRWLKDGCRDAIRAQTLRENFISFKRLCAKAQRLVREAKRASLESFASCLSRFTSSDVVCGTN